MSQPNVIVTMSQPLKHPNHVCACQKVYMARTTMYSECQCLATVAMLHSTLPTAKPEACSLSHAVLAHVKVPPKMTYISGYAGPEPSLSLDSPILFVGSLSKNTVSSPAFCKGETASNHNIKHHRDHTHAHTHTRTHMHIHTCSHAHTYAHTRTHAHIRTHMHAHTHTHTCAHTHTRLSGCNSIHTCYGGTGVLRILNEMVREGEARVKGEG